jgi:hypothetical protein
MCYAIKTVAKSWADAKTNCIAEGGNLATVTTASKCSVFCKSVSFLFSNL